MPLSTGGSLGTTGAFDAELVGKGIVAANCFARAWPASRAVDDIFGSMSESLVLATLLVRAATDR
jgi:hypothetical protein